MPRLRSGLVEVTHLAPPQGRGRRPGGALQRASAQLSPVFSGLQSPGMGPAPVCSGRLLRRVSPRPLTRSTVGLSSGKFSGLSTSRNRELSSGAALSSRTFRVRGVSALALEPSRPPQRPLFHPKAVVLALDLGTSSGRGGAAGNPAAWLLPPEGSSVWGWGPLKLSPGDL